MLNPQPLNVIRNLLSNGTRFNVANLDNIYQVNLLVTTNNDKRDPR
jgi:hypothetical protein